MFKFIDIVCDSSVLIQTFYVLGNESSSRNVRRDFFPLPVRTK